MIGTSAVIDTRDGLKAYIKRNLGEPVTDAYVHDSQLEDAINEAVSEFVPVAFDGLEKRWSLLDITCGVLSYQMPYTTYAVTGVFQTDYADYSPDPNDMFSINQYIANDLATGGLGRMDILSLELVQQQISTLGVIFGGRITYSYNAINKSLYMDTDITKDTSLNMWDGGRITRVWVEYYKSLEYTTDPSVKQNIYDVKWVQQYSTALARRQYGINLMKYEGSTLPNGMTINATSMIDMAEASKAKLMEQLHEEWEYPVDFQIG
jgi:hypothetical protein